MNTKDTYNPRSTTAGALRRGLELVQSVDYHVSARWVFYRLLQEGWYTRKLDYANKWLKAASRARHAFWGGWRPDTLADDTRGAIWRGHGPRTAKHWIADLAERTSCSLAKWHTQPNYVELWFEARAMADQFRHYTDSITLRPMGGQPSIPFKWATAKALESADYVYGQPIVILYFGDLDAGGECIEQVVRDDVTKWCDVDFDFIRCGLNPGDPERYNIPENPEKPGEFQWEALPDDAASEIITANVDLFIRHGALAAVKQQDREATAWLRGRLEKLADEYDAAEGVP